MYLCGERLYKEHLIFFLYFPYALVFMNAFLPMAVEEDSDAESMAADPTTLNLPALKIWRALPVDVLRLIGEFAQHVHSFGIVFPEVVWIGMKYDYWFRCTLCGFRCFRLPG